MKGFIENQQKKKVRKYFSMNYRRINRKNENENV